MTVLLLNDQTILGFIDDKEAFGSCVADKFGKLDVDRDGLLSRDELRQGLDGCIASDHEREAEGGADGLFDAVFDRCDEDKDGALDQEEFKRFVTEIMLALAQGIGGMPVAMVLHEDSLFVKAAELELEHRKDTTAATSVSTPRSSTKEKRHKPRLGLFLCFCGEQSGKHHSHGQVHHHVQDSDS